MILKITGIITLSVRSDRKPSTRKDQQVDQMFFILLGIVPVNTLSNTAIRISFLLERRVAQIKGIYLIFVLMRFINLLCC